MFVIGDVHGCYKTLMSLVDKILTAGGKLQDICLVGDLVDRGPASKDVVQWAIDNNIYCVLGNHEQMMIDYHNKNEYSPGIWEMNGGEETLDSYNGDTDLFTKHVEWMKKLPLYLEFPEIKLVDRYLVVSHSNVGKVWDWSEERKTTAAEQFKQNIIWDRNGQEDQKSIYNIVGHTPCPMIKERSFYANVDTGACFSHNSNYGYLSALQFPQMKRFTAKNIDHD